MTRTYDWNNNTDIPIGMSHLEDAEMAGEVRMLMRNQLNHEHICTSARDRIMCLMKERDTLADICNEFIRRVDDGEVRSTTTYNKMKAALRRMPS